MMPRGDRSPKVPRDLLAEMLPGIVPEDETAAMGLFAQVVIDVCPKLLSFVLEPLMNERYAGRRAWKELTAEEQGNIILFGRKDMKELIGCVKTCTIDPQGRLECSLGEGDKLFDRRAPRKTHPSPQNGLRELQHVLLKVSSTQYREYECRVVNVDVDKTANTTQCTLQLLNESESFPKTISDDDIEVFARPRQFYNRQVLGSNTPRGPRAQLNILKGDMDLTLMLWLLLDSAHDGKSDEQSKTSGLGHGRQDLDGFLQSLRSLRAMRNADYAHAFSFKMPKETAVEKLLELWHVFDDADKIAASNEWWPDADRLTAQFVRAITRFTTQKVNSDKYKDAMQKFYSACVQTEAGPALEQGGVELARCDPGGAVASARASRGAALARASRQRGVQARRSGLRPATRGPHRGP